MGGITDLGGSPFVSGLFLVVLWLLVGFGWIYRDAKQRESSSPTWRAIGWGWFGVTGLISYLLSDREMDRSQLLWLGGSILLFVLGATLIIGSQRWPDRGWALFIAGLYVLYWQYSLDTVGGAPDRPD